MGVNKFLNFFRVNIFAASYYHILKSARNSEITVGRAAGKVTRVQPAVLINGACGGFRHFVVAFHYVIAARHKLAVFAVGALLAGFGVNNFALNFGQSLTHGAHALLNSIVNRAHCAAGRRLCLTVGYNNFFHIHFVHNVLHYRNGAGATCHNACTHI